MDAVCSQYWGHSPRGEPKVEYLPSGRVGDHEVICPVHKAQFEATTGRVIKNVPGMIRLATHRGATGLLTYEVQVVDDTVRVRV
ncbi:MAG: hypothetical protein OK474_12455 [Thaumarchaeota archaeon]|nr:hypothetical protein [Nitrososphaerota archaeon]